VTALALVAVWVALGAVPAEAVDVDALRARTPQALQAGIEDAHPATYYILASKLFRDGKADEAVFWFYLGQLRYRVHLTARKGLDPSDDPALFSSLSEVVGRPLNEYAFGDLSRLIQTIDEVLRWDASHPNGFTPKREFAAAHADIRAGLVRLQDHVRQNGDQIRKQRAANGLPNRN
jgi:hypothetical protein